LYSPHSRCQWHLGRLHRLGTLASVASPDAIDIESGANRGALQSRISGLAKDFLDAEILFISIQTKGSLRHFSTIGISNRQYIIIEIRDKDVIVFVFHFCNHLAKNVDRIGNSTAINTTM